jgi:4-aminobutyrate aminotransferase/(S)-3-amino-2-methylpropionate transaminase
MSTRAKESTLEMLRRHESRNITFLEPHAGWPIVWKRAKGCRVWDEAGRPYLDLTAAFGVAAAGHANSAVVRAGQRQMGELLHAMGDVHPHALKARLARELSRLTFERWTRRRGANTEVETGKVIFGCSGFEAVEAALKTARLATGKPGVLAFRGGYHGVGYGALNATERSHFREPFRDQLREFGRFVEFPEADGDGQGRKKLEAALEAAAAPGDIGAVIVEPMQARGGIRMPPPWFLPCLRQWADQRGVLLIFDEIYTGFGRTGAWFACEHSGVIPDLVCLGKALTGGFPLSACVGRARVMDAWPPAMGEAIHTSTYLGHPVGCAMALAQISELRRLALPQRAARLEKVLGSGLKSLQAQFPDRVSRVSVVGLMGGIAWRLPEGGPDTGLSVGIMQEVLRHGVLLLPEGEHSEVTGITPPLTITEAELARAFREITRAVAAHLQPSISTKKTLSPRPRKKRS